MNEKIPYPKWVGVLLGVVLSGSAHFLSGGRVAGLKWYLGLFACYVVEGALVATPGTFPLLAGGLAGLASIGLWLVMLGRSYRPVPRGNMIGKATRVYWPFNRVNALEEK